VGRSLRCIHAQSPPLFKGCVSVGGGGGRTRLGSCKGGVREMRRGEEEEGNDDDASDHSQSNVMVGQRQRVGANNHESDKVHREMSLHDSFHFFFAVQPNSPTEARSTCDDLVYGAPSCPHLSVPIPTPNGPNFDEDAAPPQVVAASPPLSRCPSRSWHGCHSPTFSNLHHHLHFITPVIIICRLHRRCHHDPPPLLPLTRLHPQLLMLLTPPSPPF